MQQRAAAAGLQISVADLWLSEYVSFDDRVTMDDLVRGFDHALRQLALPDEPFACVTHSFGGPLVRAWLHAQRTQPEAFSARRLSHLVMLAPANFGSPLAHLGKGVMGRIKAWWNGVEPGQRILDWLEQGSAESLRLNLEHIHGPDPARQGQFLFVLTGDRPDRALYDHLNSYTGENGSDGVVRIAAANLNACHVLLAPQRPPSDGEVEWLVPQVTRAPRCAFKLIAGASHMGIAQGIMSSPTPATDQAIVRCLAVNDAAAYARLCDAFAAENAGRDRHKVELEPVGPFPPRVYIHDPCSLLTVRLGDDHGEALGATTYLLTAGTPPNPDWLPQGFMLDRQANARSRGVYTFFLDYALLRGDPAVPDPRDPARMLRPPRIDHRPYGCRLQPGDLGGLVHHAWAQTAPGQDLFDLLGAHQTTVLDIVLPRKVHEGLFRLTRKLAPEDFRHPPAGPVIPG